MKCTKPAVQRLICKSAVPNLMFSKFPEKTSKMETFLEKLQAQVCYFSQNISITSAFLFRSFQNNFFIEHIQVTASALQCVMLTLQKYLSISWCIPPNSQNSLEAVTSRYSIKKVFFKIFQNSLKTSVPESQSLTSFKKRLWHMCFLVNFAKFLRLLLDPHKRKLHNKLGICGYDKCNKQL